MIRITSLKLNADHTDIDILNAVSKKLRLKMQQINKIEIIKKSLDARNKSNIFWNYIVDAEVSDEKAVLDKLKNDRNVSRAQKAIYRLPERGKEKCPGRPYIIGSGPAGLFCAYFLAREGFKPVLVEQGQPIEERIKTIEKFWRTGELDAQSNIQFGEGGAGTFSDGKLNTQVNDKYGRNRLVLETFAENGAPEEILYSNKPHIGTDILAAVIANMRNKIISWGGDVLFETKFMDFAQRNGRIISAAFEKGDEILIKPCSMLVLAIGHSSRDTLYMLEKMGLKMQAKAFAAGIRIQHLREDINRAMYGENYNEIYPGCLPAADYRLACKTKDGRGVYTFCMCPGGHVVNSSSEENMLCINGMSYSQRNGKYSNSAIVVTIETQDMPGDESEPLRGIELQREFERRAFEEGHGKIPVQSLEDFKAGRITQNPDCSSLETKGGCAPADLNKILPKYICDDLKEAIEIFGKKIKGFDGPGAVLSAVESRTSSPVRILRDEHFESSVKGIFPTGEGAGYSGGITSSAMDGIKIFEEIYGRYAPQ